MHVNQDGVKTLIQIENSDNWAEIYTGSPIAIGIQSSIL